MKQLSEKWNKRNLGIAAGMLLLTVLAAAACAWVFFRTDRTFVNAPRKRAPEPVSGAKLTEPVEQPKKNSEARQKAIAELIAWAPKSSQQGVVESVGGGETLHLKMGQPLVPFDKLESVIQDAPCVVLSNEDKSFAAFVVFNGESPVVLKLNPANATYYRYSEEKECVEKWVLPPLVFNEKEAQKVFEWTLPVSHQTCPAAPSDFSSDASCSHGFSSESAPPLCFKESPEAPDFHQTEFKKDIDLFSTGKKVAVVLSHRRVAIHSQETGPQFEYRFRSVPDGAGGDNAFFRRLTVYRGVQNQFFVKMESAEPDCAGADAGGGASAVVVYSITQEPYRTLLAFAEFSEFDYLGKSQTSVETESKKREIGHVTDSGVLVNSTFEYDSRYATQEEDTAAHWDESDRPFYESCPARDGFFCHLNVNQSARRTQWFFTDDTDSKRKELSAGELVKKNKTTVAYESSEESPCLLVKQARSVEASDALTTPSTTTSFEEAGVTWVYSVFAGVFFTKTEVTVLQYEQCVQSGQCMKLETGAGCNYGHPGRKNHPVNCIDREQAEAVCGWMGGTLPTYEEWVAEASAKGAREWPFGKEAKADCRFVVHGVGNLAGGCGVGTTAPACSRPKGNSISGLCDMSGNVWEWTSTGYDCDGESSGVCGGSWTTGDSRFLKSDSVVRMSNQKASKYTGVRCVRCHFSGSCPHFER